MDPLYSRVAFKLSYLLDPLFSLQAHLLQFFSIPKMERMDADTETRLSFAESHKTHLKIAVDLLLFLHIKIHYVANSKVKVGLYVYGTSNESWRTVISAGLEADPARASTSA